MVRINEDAVRRFSETLRQMPDARSLDFYSTFDGRGHDVDRYPPLDHPQAVQFFFMVCLHQYGFWYGDRSGYRAPMFATFGGKKVKGSDAVWFALKRALDAAPELFRDRLYGVSEHEMWERLFVDDDGPIRFPDPAERLELTRRYMLADPWGPALLAESRKHPLPLERFVVLMRQMPGFSATIDPFQKKSRMLAMALMNRPERFLIPGSNEIPLPPIVDYHLMRVSLRLGLVELDESERAPNQRREWVDDKVERGIRQMTHAALLEVQRLSGASPEKLDHALWSARTYCPEMTEPDCAKCTFTSFCAKRTELFQPVFRTTAY